MKQTLLTKLAVSGYCLVFSGAFLFVGGTIFLADGVKSSVLMFAAVCVAYGLSNSVLLMLAWTRPQRSHLTVAKYSAVIIFVIYVLGSLDSGRVSGLEWVSIAFLAVLLRLNWATLRRLGSHELRA